MRGRVSGRPTKWLRATLEAPLELGKSGIRFEVWQKWKRKDKKLGTLVVSIGGLRWRPISGKRDRQMSWDKLSEMLDP